jgi:hypothetical protein
MNIRLLNATIALFAILAVLWCPQIASAQGDTAAISGYVRDASGAVVPGATVAIRNEATSVERRTTSNETGYYVVSGLAPATYTVSVTATGFKRADKTGITLTSGIGVNADMALAVGETSEIVEVIADSATVQTETAMVGKTVSTTQINNLQLNGRNPLFLALLKPGVRGGSLAGFNRGLTSGGFSINGSRSQDNLITFDGAVAVRTRSNGTSIGVADLDSTQEVQILTASYTAEYGRSAGGQIRIVTKSGTNELHGAMYEYLRNEKLDANSWTNNRNSTAARQIERNPFRYNQFGYNVSGPVFIPKFYDGRNKFFWLWSQEWIKFRQQRTQTLAVPTLNERGLNEAGQQVPINLNAAPFAGRTIRDPLSGQAFVNNQIPVNRFSPNGIALIRAFPLPTPGFQQGAANWFAQRGGLENHRKDTMSFDFVPSDNKFFKFRWQNYEYNDFDPFFGNYGVVRRTFERPNDTASLGFTYTVNPTTINETLVTASADRVLIDYDRATSQLDRGAFGINYPYLFPDGKEITNKIPTVVLGNGINDLDGGPYPASSSGPIYTISNNTTKIAGNHTIKFGVSLERAGQNDFDQINVSGVPGGTNNQNGRFAFTNNNPGGSGWGSADAALGLFNTYAEIGRRSYTPYRGHMVEWFFQDSWKATDKLRLEMGLRHSVVQPYYSLWGNMVVFDPAAYNPANAVRVNPLNGNPIANTGDPLNGLIVPGTEIPSYAEGRVNAIDFLRSRLTGESKSFSKVHLNNFQPRLGIAYAVNSKTAIRAGIGRFYTRLGVSDSVFLGGNPPLQATASVATGNVDNPGGTSGSIFPLLPTTQDAVFKNPESWNWNFTFEREVGFDTTINIGYVGRKGLHAQRERNINQLEVGTMFRPEVVNNRINQNFLRPYAGYGPIRITNNDATSFYNGLQLEANKRFSKGLLFGVAYTYSKSSDDGSAQRDIIPNAYDASGLWGPSSFDTRHLLVANVVYELPFFTDQSKLTGKMLGGWQITAVSQFQTGTPFSVATGDDFAGVGAGSGGQIWATNGTPSYPQQFSEARGDGRFWFDPTIYSRPANGTFTSGFRNNTYGPGFQNHNIGIFKSFAITETQRVTFRAEGFNWVNHPNWSGPQTNPLNADFGRVTAKNSERNIQLSLRYSF